jgi:[ribosomal protein S18]-alanine N-acetyltransferase
VSLFDWLHRHSPAGHILPLDTDHAARLADIHHASFVRPWDVVEFERLLADRAVIADGLFLGRDTAPAGYVLSRIVVDEAEILTVAIAPEARGKGHGRLLLSRHLDALSRAGAKTVHLEVEESNHPALAVYRALGFQEAGRREGYYARPDGSRRAALTMSRSL